MDRLPPDMDITQAAGSAHNMARYLIIWALALAVLIGGMVAFCLFMDPYAIIGAPRVPGVNAEKPAAAIWPRLTKAYTVQRAHPVTLILGNSSADFGFNPDSPGWPKPFRPVYNLAIDGGMPANHLRYLQHALSVIHPRHIIFAVNFGESLVQPQHQLSPAEAAGFDFEQRMLVLPDGKPNPRYRAGHFADLVFASLSFTALSDSITTLLDQNDPGATYETEAGWNNGGKFRRWGRNDGSYSLVENKDRGEVVKLATWRKHKGLQIDEVVRMVELAQAHGADATIAILPNYVDEMEIVRQLGLDADYDAWKKQLVASVWQASAGSATIWDFSGFTRYTTDPLPGPGDLAHQLIWFWEPIHFKLELGDQMIARMAGAGEPADLGTRLTPAILPQHIADYHRAESHWVATHPNDVARVAALIEQ